ncbi:24-hydroxycholesterol 7-alpha-hydroxylase isoform X10 [Gallus gallus]|uniref:24-hydroxycholesterol 7-alpha-hydroxylase isoform X10 n=1 Tax=Gallus gallus TaxID=9031 RepID=UPI001F02EE47|nr:24-hydroxycholesterol 7-alpha-hydroxylase isoform X10 [Gallus gallus]
MKVSIPNTLRTSGPPARHPCRPLPARSTAPGHNRHSPALLRPPALPAHAVRGRRAEGRGGAERPWRRRCCWRLCWLSPSSRGFCFLRASRAVPPASGAACPAWGPPSASRERRWSSSSEPGLRHIMYPAVVNTLFGKGACPTSHSELREFEEHFWKYDEDFEYASQMPECFLRNWSKSKKWLLKLFEKVVSDAERTNPSETTSKTLLQHLLDNLQGKHLAPNYGLLMLWASQANAVPIAFWTLVFILSSPSVYKKVMEDLTSVFGNTGKDEIEVSEEDLKNLPYIKWCTLEAIRLRSPGAITKKSFTIPAGDMLMLSPYWLHRNPKYFPDPEMFKPDRWKEANLEKNAFLDGFVAFGGGNHQCPGRWFAIMEIQLLVALFLYKYEFVLLDAVPKESPLHLVGTQQPLTPFRVQYKGWE